MSTGDLLARLPDRLPFALPGTDGYHASWNERLHGFGGGAEVLVIVAGPHGYVSPSWYGPMGTRAPTWNNSSARRATPT